MSHEVAFDYVESVDPNLTCAICCSALVDPVTTTSCKHTFCRDCITRAIGVNPQCPIDRSALAIGSLRDTEQLVKLMLDELKVKCAAEDCGQEMQRGLLLAHLRTCPKTITTCQDGDCGLSMARHRLPHHRAYECFQRKMECKKCGNMLIFRDRGTHVKADCCEEQSESCELCGEKLGANKQSHQWTCPQVRIPCPHSIRGCPTLISRSTLQTHLDACPFEAMSSFFEMNEARFRALEERNNNLEAEVGGLRAELRIQIAHNASRRAWTADSWVNPLASTQPASNTGAPPVITTSTTGQAQGRVNGSPTTPLARLPQPESEGSRLGFATSSPPDMTASPREPSPRSPHAFPVLAPQTQAATQPRSPGISNGTLNVGQPTSGITPRAAADLAHQHHHRSFVAPSFGSHQSYADWVFTRLSGNTSNSLDEVILALRGVVIHLAAGMDTMERRNEVRTMTESLRVLEEVGSLRAIVTTMRMQVMMDRPSRSPFLNLSSEPSYTLSPPPLSPGTASSSGQPNTANHISSSTNMTGDGEPVSEDSYLDPERPQSIRETVVFSGPRRNSSFDATSSSSSLIISANGGRTGRTVGSIGSGAGLTGRTVGIPPPGPIGHGEGSTSTGRQGSGLGMGNRLSRANPINLIRKQPSRSSNGPRL